MDFQYAQDKKFLIELLANGDSAKFEKEFLNRFDFRDPKIKRLEFDSLKNERAKALIEERGRNCQLNLVSKCNNKKLVLDHVIPLSTNELNKYLRNAKAIDGKKVPSQSIGSNHLDNLLLSCEDCNNFKKHRFVKKSGSGYEIVVVKNLKNNNAKHE